MQTIMREERLEEMQHYYADVAQQHKLSQAEATTLLHNIDLAQEQEDHVREQYLKQQLIEGYLGYVIALVLHNNKPFSAATTFADLIQEGNVALVEAVHQFSYHHATLKSFHAWIKTHITNKLHWHFYKDLPVKVDPHAYLEAKRAGREDVVHTLKYPTRLDQPLRDRKGTYGSRIAAPTVVLPSPREDEQQNQREAEQRAQLEALLPLLSPKQRAVVRLRLGLDEDRNVLLFTEVAGRLGIRPSYARALYTLAVQRLRKVVTAGK